MPCAGDIIPVLGAPEKAAPPTSKRCGVDAFTWPPRFIAVGVAAAGENELACGPWP